MQDEDNLTVPSFTTSLELVAIDENYSTLVDWVTSGGKTNTDWHLHLKE